MSSYLEADAVAAEIAKTGLPVEALMFKLIAEASALARPVLSGFKVGAVVQGVSGAIYLGCNIEFGGLPLSQTIHAEQCATVNAASHGETGLLRLAVSAPPCGYCRQFLFELSTAAQLQILLKDQEPVLLTSFLPGAFGPGDLGVKAGLLSSATHELEFSDEHVPETAVAALQAARHAYAPYTNSIAGAALRTRSGRIFLGSCMENAAFNPSMGPVQAAIAAAVIAGVGPESIVEAALVEASDSKLNYGAAGHAVLHAFCPGVNLQEFRV